jgi:hypothetical protein
MDYFISNLNAVADCNVLLSWAAREKADLDYKKLSDERMAQRFADTSLEIDALLQGVIAELAATETIISVLPEGPAKEDALDKKTRLEYKKFLLESRKESYGTVALVEKQVDLARVTGELAEMDSFIGVLEARKAELELAG